MLVSVVKGVLPFSFTRRIHCTPRPNDHSCYLFLALAQRPTAIITDTLGIERRTSYLEPSSHHITGGAAHSHTYSGRVSSLVSCTSDSSLRVNIARTTWWTSIRQSDLPAIQREPNLPPIAYKPFISPFHVDIAPAHLVNVR